MPRHETYDANLDDAQKFEDYVERKLYDRGLPIGVHRSRCFQFAYGESRAGVEIKYDRKYQQTGNLFVETAERHHKDVEMKPAGIYGKGWLLAIGDYHRLWLFGMTTLKHLHTATVEGAPRYQRRVTSTAEGFLLSVTEADKFAEQCLTECQKQEVAK